MNPQDTTPKPAAPALHDSQQLLHSSQLLLAGLGQGDNRPSGPPGLSATPTLGGLLAALRRRWLLAVMLALLASAGFVAAVFLVLMPPKFTASIQIHVAEKGDLNPLVPQNQDDTHFVIFKGTVQAKATNPKILSNALNEKTASGKEVKDLAIVRDKGIGAASWLEKALKTHYNIGPETLTITLSGDDPADVADLLNAVGAALLKEFDLEQKSKRSTLISR